MIDNIIDELRKSPVSISKDAFRVWKNHPITALLYNHLLADVLLIQSEPPPNNMEESALQAHRAYAANIFYMALLSWEPSNLVDENERTIN